MQIEKHILDRLEAFIAKPAVGFDIRFDALRNPLKYEHRNLLVYIDRVLELMPAGANGMVTFEHLHMENVDDQLLYLVGELLIIRCHFKGLAADHDQSTATLLGERIDNLQQRMGNELRDTSNLSGKSAKFKKLKASRDLLRRRRTFLENINREHPNATLLPRSLLNVLKRDLIKLKEHPGDLPYLMTTEQFKDHDTSYVLVNKDSFEDLVAIRYKDEQPLKYISDVYLFDAESRNEFSKFNTTYLQQVNKRSRTQFRALMILSVSEQSLSFSRLKGLQERVKQRYHPPAKYPKYGAYTVLASEMSALTGRRSSEPAHLELIGPETLEVWNEVLDLIEQFEGLEELKSAKFLDLYSLVINNALKGLLLQDIFGGGRSQFLSEDAFVTLTTLSQVHKQALSAALGLFLDWSISSEWPDELRRYAEDSNYVVVPPLMNAHVQFKHQLRKALQLSERQKFIDRWQLDGIARGRLLLLDYYDLGPIPDTYAYNLMELSNDDERQFIGLFLNVLFGRRHRQARYELDRHLADILEHPIRAGHFEWGLLHQRIMTTRPTESIRYHELDDKYEQQQPQQSISITLGSRTRTYSYSELFVLKDVGQNRLYVRRIGEIEANTLDQNPILAQCLTDLYVDFNIYGKLVNAAQQAEDLRVVLYKFGMEPDLPAMMLWKELLFAQVQAKGMEQVYLDLGTLLRSEGKQIVDKAHFIKNWAEPDSGPSLPRGRAIFRTICQYLDLPKNYQRIAVSIYNQEKLQKIRSSRQMNILLRDLINDGCFNDNTSVPVILDLEKQRYLRSHDLESIGIATEKAVDELSTLVELLRPQLNLYPVKMINLNQ